MPTTRTRPGENELYVRSQDGKGQPQQLTNSADTYYYQAIWSPDSKKLLWSDRLQRLRYVDVASKAVTQVDQDKIGEIAAVTIGRLTASGSPGRARRRMCGDKVYLYSPQTRRCDRGHGRLYSRPDDVDLSADDGKYLMLIVEPRLQTDLRPDPDLLQCLSRSRSASICVTLFQGNRSHRLVRAAMKSAKRDKDKTRTRISQTLTRRRTRRKATRKSGEDKDKDKELRNRCRKVDLDGIQDRIARPRYTARATTPTFAWWIIGSSIAAAPLDDQARATTTMARRRRRNGISVSYSLEDRKETVLGDVNNSSDHCRWEEDAGKDQEDYAIIDLPKDKLETEGS